MYRVRLDAFGRYPMPAGMQPCRHHPCRLPPKSSISTFVFSIFSISTWHPAGVGLARWRVGAGGSFRSARQKSIVLTGGLEEGEVCCETGLLLQGSSLRCVSLVWGAVTGCIAPALHHVVPPALPAADQQVESIDESLACNQF